ncbi:MAG: RNA polymerase sigma factor [Gemmatimonadota bacterium]|nr:MAG: RNA polymerase sigma factor [Gemmatimonadota bacterium]
MEERELTALAGAFQQGDTDAFKRLVDALTRPLVAMAYRYTGDWEWARDLTQETWVRVHDRIRRYDPVRSFRAWVFTIHRNACLSHLRRAWVKHETTPGEGAIGELGAVFHTVDPLDDLERREFHQRLLVALGQLSESQRQVFVQVDLEEGDQKEVAQALGIKHTTLRATLHFARRRLAAALREMEELQ